MGWEIHCRRVRESGDERYVYRVWNTTTDCYEDDGEEGAFISEEDLPILREHLFGRLLARSAISILKDVDESLGRAKERGTSLNIAPSKVKLDAPWEEE